MNPADEMIQAVKTRDTEKVRSLLRTDPALARLETDAGSILLTAVYHGAQDAIAEILAAHPDPNIFEAAATGQAGQIARILARNPAAANSFNGNGFTPLGLAAHFGHPEAVRALIAGGAEVSALSRSTIPYVPSNTALHAALAGRKDPQVICLLLEAGADPTVADSNGMTPLHVAAYNGSLELGSMLLKAGAPITARGRNGKTPLEVAAEQGDPAMVELLRQHGATE